jgi:pSer/pThr/pTyr-binding forkhead associated (FHA) protein
MSMGLELKDLQTQKLVSVSKNGLTLGREGGKAELRLNDRGVSSLHCKIFCDNGVFYVEDLGSTNGTFVDGKKIAEKTVLKGGTALALFRYRFEVLNEEDALATQLQPLAPKIDGQPVTRITSRGTEPIAIDARAETQIKADPVIQEALHANPDVGPDSEHEIETGEAKPKDIRTADTRIQESKPTDKTPPERPLTTTDKAAVEKSSKSAKLGTEKSGVDKSPLNKNAFDKASNDKAPSSVAATKQVVLKRPAGSHFITKVIATTWILCIGAVVLMLRLQGKPPEEEIHEVDAQPMNEAVLPNEEKKPEPVLTPPQPPPADKTEDKPAEPKPAEPKAAEPKHPASVKGKTPFPRYAEKRKAIEDAVRSDPTLLKSKPGVLPLFRKMSDETARIQDKRKPKRKGSKVDELLLQADIYEATANLVDDLHRVLFE